MYYTHYSPREQRESGPTSHRAVQRAGREAHVEQVLQRKAAVCSERDPREADGPVHRVTAKNREATSTSTRLPDCPPWTRARPTAI